MTAQQLFGMEPSGVQMEDRGAGFRYVALRFDRCPRLPCDACTRRKDEDGWVVSVCDKHGDFWRELGIWDEA